MLALLGRLPDKEVAHRAGIDWKYVAAKRKTLGIAYRAARFRPWTEAEIVLLGTMPDHQLAKQSDRTKVAIGLLRCKRRGVPAFRS